MASPSSSNPMATIQPRNRAEMKAGKAPGPSGPLGKLFGLVIMWRYREIAMQNAGLVSQAWGPDGDDGGLAMSVVGSSLVEHRRRH
jgi:hypothetical protein